METSDSAPGSSGLLERLAQLRKECASAPRFGANARHLILQAAALASLEAAPQVHHQGPALLELVPPTQRPHVAYVPRSFLAHRQREDVAARLAGHFLALLMQALGVAPGRESQVVREAAVAKAASDAAVAQELRLYRSITNKLAYQERAAKASASLNDLPPGLVAQLQAAHGCAPCPAPQPQLQPPQPQRCRVRDEDASLEALFGEEDAGDEDGDTASPSARQSPPAETQAAPAETQAARADSQAVHAGSQDPPSGSGAADSVSQVAPSLSAAAPLLSSSGSQAAPADSQAAPAGSQDAGAGAGQEVQRAQAEPPCGSAPAPGAVQSACEQQDPCGSAAGEDRPPADPPALPAAAAASSGAEPTRPARRQADPPHVQALLRDLFEDDPPVVQPPPKRQRTTGGDEQPERPCGGGGAPPRAAAALSAEQLRAQVRRFVQSLARPLLSANVITEDVYELVVARGVAKVMERHADASEAGFLLKECGKIQALVTSLVEFYSVRKHSTLTAAKRCVVTAPKRTRFPPRRAGVACAAPGGARAAPTASQVPGPPHVERFQRSIWTAIDVAALLGSVGGALAALLGVVSPTYALALPLVLPVVSLVAALQREDASREASRQYYGSLSSTLGRDTQSLMAEARAAIDEVRGEVRAAGSVGARVGAVEGRLGTLEATVISSGRSARDAAVGVAALSERLAAQQRSSQDALLAAVRGELRLAAEAQRGEAAAALAQLDSRLGAVEGSLASLEVTQGEGLRRMSSTFTNALLDAEGTLQASVRAEVGRNLEPLQRLPATLAAALPSLPPPSPDQQPAAALTEGALLQQLRALVAEEVQAAAQQLMEGQAGLAARLAAPPRPAPLDEEQWEALGRRLSRLERLVEAVPELGQQALAAQLAPLATHLPAASAAAEEAVVQLQDLRQQLAAQQQQQRQQPPTATASTTGAGEEAAAGQVLAAALQLQEAAAALRAQAAALQAAAAAAVAGAAEAPPPPESWPAPGEVAGQLASLQAGLEEAIGMLSAVAKQLPPWGGGGGPSAADAAAAAAQASGTAAAEEAGAAAQAAATAAAEVRALARDLQGAAGALSEQLGALRSDVAAVAAEQAARAAAGVASGQVAAELAALGQGLGQQLDGLELRLTEAARSAAAAAAAAASVAGVQEAAGGFDSWLQDKREALAAAAASAADAGGAVVRAATGGEWVAAPAQEEAWGAAALEQDPSAAAALPNGDAYHAPGGGSAGAGAAWAPQAPGGAGGEPAPVPRWDEVASASSTAAEPWVSPQATSDAAWQAYGDAPYDGAAAGGEPSPPPPSLPDPSALASEALLPVGLRLLRAGRAEMAAERDYGLADALLQRAVAAFSRAADDAGAGDGDAAVKALGNLGNALLAQGELKGRLLAEVSASVASADPQELEALALAELRLRSEALSLLTRAGEMFRSVLERSGWSSRALVNWGRALTERAALAQEEAAVEKLYGAAIDKFEAVLEEEPEMLPAKYRCALALRGVAALKEPGSSAQRQLLGDAANYLADVAGASGPDADEALREAARAALRGVQEQLEVAALR